MSDESSNVRPSATAPHGAAAEPGDERVPTIRTTPVDADPDALPEQASQYVAPQAAPKISEHKTIDMVPVRLAPDVDPRRAMTRRLEPASDVGKARVLLLSAGVVFLLLAAIIGALRLLRASVPDRAESANNASLDAVGPQASAAEPVVPAAATLTPAPLEAPAPAAASAAERASSSEANAVTKPAAKPQKGKQLWLE